MPTKYPKTKHPKTEHQKRAIVSPKQRHVGIDLLRGIAVLAVVMLHSGDKTWGDVSPNAEILRSWIRFPVPFFLIVSFYFSTSRLMDTAHVKRNFLFSRCQRLLIPLWVWTGIYFSSKLILYKFTGQSQQLTDLVQDPTSILFLGGASYHLYFVPWLFWGSLLIPLLQRYQIPWNLLTSLTGLITSLSLAEWMIDSGNGFALGPNIAFQSIVEAWMPDANQTIPIRLFLVLLAWSISCLPYIFAAVVLHILLPTVTPYKQGGFSHKTTMRLWLTLAACLFIKLVASNSSAATVEKLSFSCCLLTIGILLSAQIKSSLLIAISQRLGSCVFGIYLLHPFVLQFVELMAVKAIPSLSERVTVESILIISLPTFFVSWLLVMCMYNHKILYKYAFGF